MCPHVQNAFLKLTICDNQASVGCIPIATVVGVTINPEKPGLFLRFVKE